MPRTSRLSIAKRDIARLFEAQQTRVFTRREIEVILSENRLSWRLAESTTASKFIDFLIGKSQLEEVRLDFAYRPVIRYTWGTVQPIQLLQSIHSAGYFSHFTAMQLHGLTDQIPKTMYFNIEQRLTGGGGVLTQPAIDRAFKLKPRTSQNVAVYRNSRVCLLNGRRTDALGVVLEESGQGVRVTGIERTLIDAAVRPVYAGGVSEVAKAYRAAHDQVSINKLLAQLRKLNYTYPYHQAIGFYLEHSGAYRDAQLELLRQIPMEFDFYLTYQMKQVEYVKEWRLWVPKGFQ